MPNTLRVLFAQHESLDFDRVMEMLRKTGRNVLPHKLESDADLAAVLQKPLHMVICGYTPEPGGTRTLLQMLQDNSAILPVIIICDSASEMAATDLINYGAEACVRRDALELLPAYVQRAMSVRMQADQAKRDELLITVMEQLPALLWSVDTELIITSSTGTWLSKVGVKPRELVGVHLMEYMQTDDPNYRPLAMHLRALKGESVSYELSWAPHILKCHLEPLRNPKGEIIGCIGVALDITEAKRAEHHLRASEQLNRRILESVPGGVFQVDRNGVLMQINAEAEQFLHLSKDQIGQTSIASYDLATLNDDGTVCPKEDYPVSRCLRTGERHGPNTVGVVQPDGSTVWGIFNAVPVFHPQSGELDGAIVTFLDITASKHAEMALRQSEERYRRLVESAPMGLLVHRDEKVVYVNDAICRLLRAKPEDLIGISIWNLLPPDLHGAVKHRVQTLATEGGTMPLMEQRLIRPDKTTVDVEVVSTAADFDGEPAQQVMFQDITARKHSAEMQRQHQSELSHALRLATMGEIAAGMAHDLSQPLSAIVNYTRGCIRRIRSGRTKIGELLEPLEQAASQAELAGRIVHGLWNLIHKRPPQRRNTYINNLIREAVQIMHGQFRRLNVDVQLELNSSLPPVHVEAVQIEQVILNFVINALDAMTEASTKDKRLTITSTLTDEGDIQVSVHDNGPGMTEEVLQSMYDPFFTTKVHGLGMGLSICRSIILIHAGHLSCESTPQKGTTFSFVLPAVSAREPVSA